MNKQMNLQKLVVLLLAVLMVLSVTVVPAGAATIPNWESLYKTKVQQIESEYTQGKRTKDSTYNTVFFSLQDLNFDGVPELYHALVKTTGGEYTLQEGTEEIYYIKNNRVVLGKIGNHETLGLLPASSVTGTMNDRRGQFAMYNQAKGGVFFITKDSWTDGADQGLVTISELTFDANKGMLNTQVMYTGIHARGYEPSWLDGYMYIGSAATYSKSSNKNFDLWKWDAPYVIPAKKETTQTQTSSTSQTWKGAYEKFIINRGYASAGQTYHKNGGDAITFGIRDIDKDGTPELIASNGMTAENEKANYIYIYKNSKVVYLGKTIGSDSTFMLSEDSRFPGLFLTGEKDGEYNSYYYTVKDGKLIQAHIMKEIVRYENNKLDYSVTQITKDNDLYEACKVAKTKFVMLSQSAIKAQGWNSFAAAAEDNIALFSDVGASSWFYDAVLYAVEKNIMSGVSADKFDPNGSVTRGMFITMMYRLEGEPATKRANFKDVSKGSWYENSISWATQKGIANGVDDTNFAPDSGVTREQLMVFLYRYAKLKNKSVTASKHNIKAFFDNSRVAEYAEDAMNWAIENNFISGTSEFYLSPSGNATRAQAAVILQRFCEKYKIK